jgi:hypothetical protein
MVRAAQQMVGRGIYYMYFQNTCFAPLSFLYFQMRLIQGVLTP